MQALAQTTEDDCYTRAANDDCFYGGPGTRTKFYYDNDYRLTESKLNGTENLGVTYDASGNITSRTDLASGASWTYDPNRYHAVTEAGSSSYTFTYDTNGNAITRFGSAISWSSYNYPTSVTAVDVTGTENVQFSYGPDRSRWMQNYDSGTETTYYIGGLMEEVETNITDYRHYVYAGSEPVAILSRKSTGVNTWSYLLSDHIGSVAAITSSTGAVDINESFTSFGARRNPTTWSGPPASVDLTTIAGLSREGFTFQTALGQSMGLNHMNGRVQDAITGRFLSADPNIPDPTSAQSYNRFSYVSNNPLTRIDPSGFYDADGSANGSCLGCDWIIVYQAPGSAAFNAPAPGSLQWLLNLIVYLNYALSILNNGTDLESEYGIVPTYSDCTDIYVCATTSVGTAPIWWSPLSGIDWRTTPGSMSIVSSEPNGDYSTYWFYQLQNLGGGPITDSGYYIAEYITPSTGDNANGDYTYTFPNNLYIDNVGYQNPPTALDDSVDTQTFGVLYDGYFYHLDTTFQHEHLSVPNANGGYSGYGFVTVVGP